MINLYDLLKAANGQLFGEAVTHLFTDFCLDPRQAREGVLFVALRSNRGDTHHDIEEAIHRGVSGVVCNEPPPCDTTGVSVLMVRDSVDALMSWVQFTLGKLRIKTIAVTGSFGKSTAVSAIHHVLSARYKVLEGNREGSGRLALALSLASLNSEHEYVVVKLDPTQPGEMKKMVEAIQPDIGIITGLDTVQQAPFETVTQYLDEFYALIDSLMSPEARLIMNYDDPRTRELISRAKGPVRTIGIDQFGADLMAYNVKPGLERTGFDVRAEERYLGRWSPVPGKQNLYSLLSALMVARESSISLDDALKSLRDLQPLPGRMKPLVGQNNAILIDDSYRANVSSTLAALDWLNYVKTEGQRVIFVFGDMDTLGRNSQYGHRTIGARAAEVVDILITQGGEAALAGRSAIDQGKDPRSVHTTYSVQDTVTALLDLQLDENDVILLKGGAGAQLEQVIAQLLAKPEDRIKLVRQDALPPINVPRYPLRPAWLEINREQLVKNMRAIRGLIASDVTLMAVVKANAYGHGAVMVARTALLNGAAYLGVANIAEAIELRDAGIEAPILVMSYTPVNALRQAVQQNLTVTLFDLDMARAYDRAMRDLDGKLKYHVKVDTGMGRLGIMPDEAVMMFRNLPSMKKLELEGIYTHFASAESDPTQTQSQLDAFKSIVRAMRAAGMEFKYIHAANSAGVAQAKEGHFNMVRVGLMLYGLNSAGVTPPPDIKPIMSWKTTVLQVKTLPKDHAVGYGAAYRTTDNERVAILPVGYADGMRRAPSAWKEVLINGKRAPIIGRISMEKCAVSLTNVGEVSPGDEVVLLGTQGGETISADQVADWLQTNNYEVVTSLGINLAR
jgi:Alr-MurF fusion protein